MILLIGQNNCSRCLMIKKILDNKNIQYEYKLISDLSKEEQLKYTTVARENNMLSMPLIFKDDKIITIQEVK